MENTNTEIEVRFLEVDKQALIARLKDAGALDKGEELLREIIFYDKDMKWRYERKLIRLRQSPSNVSIAFKQYDKDTVDGTKEVEVLVNDFQAAKDFLEMAGFAIIREQEKKRHTFTLNGASIDIDTWPRVPAYVEIEAPKEEMLRETAEKLGLDWSRAVFENARKVIENRYGIPVNTFRYFTFERIE